LRAKQLGASQAGFAPTIGASVAWRPRGVTAVETFARKGRADNPSGPVGFFFGKGFGTYRDDAEFPLQYLDP